VATKQEKKKSPKNVTIFGRLSFPTWTAQAAFDRGQKGKFPPKTVADAAPDFNLLVDQAQYDKLVNHVLTEFLPYCVQQEVAGEKRDALAQDEVDEIVAQIEKKNFAKGVYNTPFKVVHEKTAPLVPEAIASIKCIGNKGVDIDLKAIVNDESELAVPDPEVLSFPILRPIGQTVHQMFPGCYVAATLNLYAYHNGKLPGFSAGAATAVFKAEGERLGGGLSVDEDEIFLDD
jgi:hypothetical protein